MRIEDFSNLLRVLQERDTVMMMKRSAVYSVGDDKFYNFRRAAGVTGTTPEKTAWGMALKHLVSVQDIIEATEDVHPTMYSRDYYSEVIQEKFTDLRNYLYLIEGMLTERIVQDESPSR